MLMQIALNLLGCIQREHTEVFWEVEGLQEDERGNEVKMTKYACLKLSKIF